MSDLKNSQNTNLSIPPRTDPSHERGGSSLGQLGEEQTFITVDPPTATPVTAKAFVTVPGSMSANKKVLPRQQPLNRAKMTEQNIQKLEPPQVNEPSLNSEFLDTNASLVSTNSSYQNNISDDIGDGDSYHNMHINDDDDDDDEEEEEEVADSQYEFTGYNKSLGSTLKDPIFRPLSQNSTTSCLSTTATKDGIEGRHIHRHGPSAYSQNIISTTIGNGNQFRSPGQLHSSRSPEVVSLNPSTVGNEYDDTAFTSYDDIKMNPQDSQNASIVSLHQPSITQDSPLESNAEIDR